MSQFLDGLLAALRSAPAQCRQLVSMLRRPARAAPGVPVLPFIAVANIVGLLAADQGWLRTQPATALAAGALLASARVHSFAGRRLLAAILFFALGVMSLGSRLDEAGRKAVGSGFDATVEGVVCSVRLGLQRATFELCDVTRTRAATPALPSRLIVSQPLDDSSAASRLASSAGPRPGARSRLTVGGSATPALGQRLRARLRLRPVTGLRNPGSDADGRRWLRRGIGARAWIIDDALMVRISGRDRNPFATRLFSDAGRMISTQRRALGALLARRGEGGALLAALSLGERSLLGADVRARFATLGLAHLLAVSGLHLALVTALVFGAARGLLVRVRPLARRHDVRRPALLFAASSATVYAVVAGFDLPVQRALVFVWAVVLAVASRRRPWALQVLSLASLIVLGLDPSALFRPGAQLSFAATAALLSARSTSSMRTMEGGIALQRARAMLSTSALAVAATAPLLAAHGWGVGPWGLLCNLVAVPWTACLLLPASLGAALAGSMPASPLGSWVVDAGVWIADLTLLAVESLAHVLPEVSPRPWVHAATLALAGALAICAVWTRRVWGRLLLALAVCGVLQWGPARHVLPPPPRLVALDVGQGDSIVIQGVRGSVLIDGGRAIPGRFDLGRSVVVPALRALGIEALDLVIATHADLDHLGGLPSVLSELPVGELWIPRVAADEPGFAHLIRLAQQRGVRVVEQAARPGRSPASPAMVVMGDVELQILWPHAAAGVVKRNDTSLVVRAALAGKHILLTGDLSRHGERALIESGVDLAVDILKLGHHGSATSSSAQFLSASHAEIAIVSAPCGGRNGLPSPDVLDRVRAGGVTSWWTGRDGAVLVGLGDSNAPLVVVGWAYDPLCASTAH